MLVYRIEHRKTGHGPYFRSGPARDIVMRIYSRQRHVEPSEDDGMRDQWRGVGWATTGGTEVYSFGFYSLEQMRTWFYKDDVRAELASIGWVLVVYEVDADDVIAGYTQLAFRRDRAKAVYAYEVY